MKKQLITLLICSAAFVSCSDDDKVPTPAPTPSSGIKEGSQLTFTRSSFDVTGTTLTQSDDYTITFVQDTTINGEIWYVAEIADPNAGKMTTLMKFTSDGMFNYKNGVPVLDLKFKAQANDTWTNSNGETVMVKALNQNITVPGGSFTNVTMIETSDANSLENKIWYNDEQFMLKHEEYDEYPPQSGQMVLDYRDELKSIDL